VTRDSEYEIDDDEVEDLLRRLKRKSANAAAALRSG